MIPRQLTWLHLLPADSTFDVVSAKAPSWLRESLPRLMNGDQPKTTVAFDQCAEHGPLGATQGFVGINCRKLSDQTLASAGMGRIARYAVLPGWHNPRWFIPLENPHVSSAGFNLYTPAKMSARLKRFAARVAVHSRLPFWYRDQLLIAQREPSPLVRALSDLFPGQQVHIALSAGAPDGALNRKASAAAIGADGTVLAFLKLATTRLTRDLLLREANVLGKLAGSPELAPRVPRLLGASEIDGTFVLIQAPLPGSPAPLPVTPLHENLFDALASGPAVEPEAIGLVRSLPDRIAALPQPHPELAESLNGILAALADQRIRRAVVHGDFAPWNLRLQDGRLSIFDWEYGDLDGPAGLDEIHYRLQVGYLIHNWSVGKTVAEVCETAVLDRYLSQPGPAARRALVALYLVELLVRLYSEGYDRSNDMIAWKLELLALLGYARPAARLKEVA